MIPSFDLWLKTNFQFAKGIESFAATLEDLLVDLTKQNSETDSQKSSIKKEICVKCRTKPLIKEIFHSFLEKTEG